MKYSGKKQTGNFRVLYWPIVVFLAFPITQPAFGADNSPISKDDILNLCSAAAVVCQESCAAAKYTHAQRIECIENCRTTLFNKCIGQAARSNSVTGDVNTGGVLMQSGTKNKKKRVQKP